MKLTSRSELALKAMIELARLEPAGDESLSASELATRCAASLKFLEQILSQLRAGGFVASSRGRTGGYRLTRDSSAVFVGQVIRHLAAYAGTDRAPVRPPAYRAHHYLISC